MFGSVFKLVCKSLKVGKTGDQRRVFTGNGSSDRVTVEKTPNWTERGFPE